MIGSYGLCLCHQIKVGFFLDFTPFSKTHSLCNIQQHFPYSESEIGGKRSVKSKNVSGSRFHFIIIRCFGLQQHLHMLIQFIVLRLHIHSDRSAMTFSMPILSKFTYSLSPTNKQSIVSSLTFYNRDYVSPPLSLAYLVQWILYPNILGSYFAPGFSKISGCAFTSVGINAEPK